MAKCLNKILRVTKYMYVWANTSKVSRSRKLFPCVYTPCACVVMDEAPALLHDDTCCYNLCYGINAEFVFVKNYHDNVIVKYNKTVTLCFLNLHIFL